MVCTHRCYNLEVIRSQMIGQLWAANQINCLFELDTLQVVHNRMGGRQKPLLEVQFDFVVGELLLQFSYRSNSIVAQEVKVLFGGIQGLDSLLGTLNGVRQKRPQNT